jgi:preprotein translocase subunit SecD
MKAGLPAAAFVCFLLSAADAAPGGSFEVRLVVECAGGMTAFALEAPDGVRPTELLCVSPDVIMTEGDVVKVVKVNEFRNAVAITYSPAAQARMSQVTWEFVGRRLALMAHGKLLSAPVISQPISGNTVEVTGRAEDLDRILRDLTNGSRPL